MVIAHIERKPEQMCVGDDSQHLSNVVQNGLRTLRHHKDMRAKIMEHPLVRVLGGWWLRVGEVLAYVGMIGAVYNNSVARENILFPRNNRAHGPPSSEAHLVLFAIWWGKKSLRTKISVTTSQPFN